MKKLLIAVAMVMAMVFGGVNVGECVTYTPEQVKIITASAEA